MTINQYHFALSEISNYSDHDAYVSDLALSSAFPEDSDPVSTASQLRMVWDAWHMSIADLRAASGLSRVDFSRRYAIPLRSVENWESTGSNARECPVYLRLLLAESLGLLPEVR